MRGGRELATRRAPRHRIVHARARRGVVDAGAFVADVRQSRRERHRRRGLDRARRGRRFAGHRIRGRHHDAARRVGVGGRFGRRGRYLCAWSSRTITVEASSPFSPSAPPVDDARFEQLFATPRAHDLVTIARAFGHEATTRDDPFTTASAPSRRHWTAAV